MLHRPPHTRKRTHLLILLALAVVLPAAHWDPVADRGRLQLEADTRDHSGTGDAITATLAAYRLGSGPSGGLLGDPGWHWWRLAGELAPDTEPAELRAWRLLATGRARELLALSSELNEPAAWACLADGDWRRITPDAATPLARYARSVALARSGLVEALPSIDRTALLRCEADPHGLIGHGDLLTAATAAAMRVLSTAIDDSGGSLSTAYACWLALDRAWHAVTSPTRSWSARLQRTDLAACRDRLLVALILSARARCRDDADTTARDFCRDLAGQDLAATLLRAEAWSPAAGIAIAQAVDALLAAGAADDLAPGIIAGLAADLHARQPAIVERRGSALLAATAAARPACRARLLARLQGGLDDELATTAKRLARAMQEQDPWRPALRQTKGVEPRKRSELPRFEQLQPARQYRSAQIDYESGTTPWFPGAAEDHYAIRWHGDLLIEQSGDYRFELESDDGSRLLIDGETVIDNDGMHGMTPVASEPVTLTAGPHAIVVEFFEAAGGEGCRLRWRPPGQGPFRLLPSTALQADGEAGLLADYFDDRLQGSAETDVSAWHVADLVAQGIQLQEDDHLGAAALAARAAELAPDNVAVIDLQVRLAIDAERWATARSFLQRGLAVAQGWQRQRFLAAAVRLRLANGELTDVGRLARELARAQPLLGGQRLAQVTAASGDWTAAADRLEQLADHWGHVDLRAAALAAGHGDDLPTLARQLQKKLNGRWWIGDQMPACGPWWWSLVLRVEPRATWEFLSAKQLPTSAAWRIYLADCALAVGDLARVERLVKAIDRKDLSPAGQQRRTLLRLLAKKLSRPAPGRAGNGGSTFDCSQAALAVLAGHPIDEIDPPLAELQPQARWYLGLALAARGDHDTAMEHLQACAAIPATPASPWPRYAASCHDWLGAQATTAAPIPAIKVVEPEPAGAVDDVEELGAEGF